MGCGCGGDKGKRYAVQLSSGMTITKTSKAAADAFAAKHPGAKVIAKT